MKWDIMQLHNILLVRTDRLGDVVLTLPMAAFIKEKYPNAKVSLLVRQYTAPIVECAALIDEVLVLVEKDGKIPVRENTTLLRNRNFDAAILVSPNAKLAWILYIAISGMRIGTGLRWYSPLLTDRIYTHRKHALRHEAEYNTELLAPLGITKPLLPGEANFALTLKALDELTVENRLREYSVSDNKPIIILHPGSGGSAVDLPKEKFIKLTQILAAAGTMQLLITGSPHEMELCKALEIPGKTVNFCGQFSLAELAALYNRAAVFIGNSTGPLHLAAALGVFTIGFYPKITVCNAVRWGPYSENKRVFTPEIGCSNCSREQCARLDCMNSINIEEAANTVFAYLNKQTDRSEYVQEPQE